MSDLIARLKGPDPDDCPACRTDATVAIACGRGECVALRKLRAEAAAALAAKDAEIAGLLESSRKDARQIARTAALFVKVNGERKRLAAEIATLRARLAAADVLAEKAGALCSPWLARHNPTKEMEETVAALAAYNAAKEVSDAG